MLKKTVTIQNNLGLHARAAAQFVQTANNFTSELTVEKDGVEVNGKSIMGIMMLAAAKGCDITISAAGDDEEAAVAEIIRLISRKFNEEA